MKAIYVYILLFFLYSFFGWILEVSCKLVSEKKFINRGFLIGPYCPIYGFGAILMSTLLRKYLNDPFTLFIMTILLCSVLEYFTSYCLEKIFKTRWWDYSTKRFQINGRICLETMIPFGMMGLFLMYVSNPFFMLYIQRLSNTILFILSGFLFLIMIIDACFSIKIMNSLTNMSLTIRTDSTERVTKLVRKEIMKHNLMFQRRLIEAFPKLKIMYSKGLARKNSKEKAQKRAR